MNQGADWNIGNGQAVASPYFCRHTRYHGIAYFQIQRGDDIALLAIGIEEQRQPGGPVGIVFDSRHRGGISRFSRLKSTTRIIAA